MKAALIRYRVMAWVVGVMLLVLCAATWEDWVRHDDRWISAVGPVHGFLYVVYLLATIDLARRVRWSAMKTLGVCVGGTVPFLSFVLERRISRQVSRTLDQAADTTQESRS